MRRMTSTRITRFPRTSAATLPMGTAFPTSAATSRRVSTNSIPTTFRMICRKSSSRIALTARLRSSKRPTSAATSRRISTNSIPTTFRMICRKSSSRIALTARRRSSKRPTSAAQLRKVLKLPTSTAATPKTSKRPVLTAMLLKVLKHPAVTAATRQILRFPAMRKPHSALRKRMRTKSERPCSSAAGRREAASRLYGMCWRRKETGSCSSAARPSRSSPITTLTSP